MDQLSTFFLGIIALALASIAYYLSRIEKRLVTRQIESLVHDPDEVDELFVQAVRLALGTGKLSASFLQRRLSIGYARASRIVDQIISAGLVSEPSGAKPIKVYKEKIEEYLKN
jgi:S-DNA-T family DNA segregation ATPase FtsK/SpoIIIE